MPVMYPGGTILATTAGTTAATGDWHTIDARYGDLSWQAILTASSAGATAGSTVTIQVSNSTAVPATTSVHTIALTCTTNTVSNGGVLAQTTMQGAWKYVRAVLGSLTTSTAGATGSPAVTVYAYATKQS